MKFFKFVSTKSFTRLEPRRNRIPCKPPVSLSQLSKLQATLQSTVVSSVRQKFSESTMCYSGLIIGPVSVSKVEKYQKSSLFKKDKNPSCVVRLLTQIFYILFVGALVAISCQVSTDSSLMIGSGQKASYFPKPSLLQTQLFVTVTRQGQFQCKSLKSLHCFPLHSSRFILKSFAQSVLEVP